MGSKIRTKSCEFFWDQIDANNPQMEQAHK